MKVIWKLAYVIEKKDKTVSAINVKTSKSIYSLFESISVLSLTECDLLATFWFHL